MSFKFHRVVFATINPEGTKVAYIAEKNKYSKRALWVNERQVSPEFDDVSFAQRLYNKTGQLIFAGYDKAKAEITIFKRGED